MVLIAIFVPLIMIGGIPFKIALAIVSILTFKEVIDLKKHEKDLPSIIKIIGVLGLLLMVCSEDNAFLLNLGLSFKTVGILMISLLIPTIFFENSKYNTKDAFYLLGWIILLATFFNGLDFLVNYNILYLIFLLIITILNDTFALIFGKLIGKHKLIPSVSPNKTWEGSICGALLGSFVAFMFYINIINPTISYMNLILIVLILSIIAQLGDLVFSKIKREAKIKDFSKLIPGHGGLLDRFDSLIFAVIAFLVMASLI